MEEKILITITPEKVNFTYDGTMAKYEILGIFEMLSADLKDQILAEQRLKRNCKLSLSEKLKILFS